MTSTEKILQRNRKIKEFGLVVKFRYKTCKLITDLIGGGMFRFYAIRPKVIV